MSKTPEIFFFCQIEGCSNLTEGGDGIFVEASLEHGQKWVPVTPLKLIQTQGGYVDEDDYVCFAHPFNAHFTTTSYFGWPKLTAKIYKLDETDTIDLVSYGTMNMPITPGYHECTCDTWSLHGSRHQETFSYFLDSKPNMRNDDPVTKKPNFREFLVTKPGPKIHINIEVMMKNFKNNEYNLSKF